MLPSHHSLIAQGSDHGGSSPPKNETLLMMHEWGTPAPTALRQTSSLAHVGHSARTAHCCMSRCNSCLSRMAQLASPLWGIPASWNPAPDMKPAAWLAVAHAGISCVASLRGLGGVEQTHSGMHRQCRSPPATTLHSWCYQGEEADYPIDVAAGMTVR